VILLLKGKIVDAAALRKIERTGSVLPPAHAISIKNKHLLVIYAIPARGFTAAVSVFGAHLLRSP
jgi:hypothetical protein